MKFLSVFSSVETNAPPSPEEMERMGKLVEEGMKAGYLLDVQGCMPSGLGARVRRAGDKITVTSGPFAESELIGGLAIIQADSKEEALEHVRYFLRAAGDGVCELRQLFTEEDCPGAAAGHGEQTEAKRPVSV